MITLDGFCSELLGLLEQDCSESSGSSSSSSSSEEIVGGGGWEEEAGTGVIGIGGRGLEEGLVTGLEAGSVVVGQVGAGAGTSGTASGAASGASGAAPGASGAASGTSGAASGASGAASGALGAASGTEGAGRRAFRRRGKGGKHKGKKQIEKNNSREKCRKYEKLVALIKVTCE